MKILHDESAIRAGVDDVARRITAHYAGREVTVLVVLRGGIVFAADLIRRLDLPVALDTIGVASYNGTAPDADGPRLLSTPQIDLRGRHVLIVDDILDSGRTLSRLREEVARRGASSVATAVLLDKPSRRTAPVEADFKVFTVPDVWVVGYGLDHHDRYRNLPYIAAFEPER